MELIDLSDSYMNKIILSLARIFLGKAKNAPLVLMVYTMMVYTTPLRRQVVKSRTKGPHLYN